MLVALVQGVLARMTRRVVVLVVAGRHCHIEGQSLSSQNINLAGNVRLSQAMALTAGVMKSRAEARVKKTVENCMMMMVMGVERLVYVNECQVRMMSR